ncbi:MAG TPA: hypothetical protein VMF89_23695, partial [Polyangiales bacterium]|nr:hypothetical protein [Polyangiales bacterium]
MFTYAHVALGSSVGDVQPLNETQLTIPARRPDWVTSPYPNLAATAVAKNHWRAGVLSADGG